MPDAALARTKRQFSDLLTAAAAGMQTHIALYSLPAVPRGDRGRQHIAGSYLEINELWRNPPDIVVVTGTEPREQNLRDEPYWSALAALIDWAEEQRISAMFSCLAAHAAVLHTDNVARKPGGYKCFGVFDHEVAFEYDLMRGVGSRMWLPHSRWNEVTETALLDAGYQILSRCDEAGVGFFAKERRSVSMFCQGHPEYDGANLLLEYRRDVRRFLLRERSSYPDLPRGYFTEDEARLLSDFRKLALAETDETLMSEFPCGLGPGPTWEPWRTASVKIMRNWLAGQRRRGRRGGLRGRDADQLNVAAEADV